MHVSQAIRFLEAFPCPSMCAALPFNMPTSSAEDTADEEPSGDLLRAVFELGCLPEQLRQDEATFRHLWAQLAAFLTTYSKETAGLGASLQEALPCLEPTHANTATAVSLPKFEVLKACLEFGCLILGWQSHSDEISIFLLSLENHGMDMKLGPNGPLYDSTSNGHTDKYHVGSLVSWSEARKIAEAAHRLAQSKYEQKMKAQTSGRSAPHVKHHFTPGFIHGACRSALQGLLTLARLFVSSPLCLR
jgi:hypothetical protein